MLFEFYLDSIYGEKSYMLLYTLEKIIIFFKPDASVTLLFHVISCHAYVN